MGRALLRCWQSEGTISHYDAEPRYTVFLPKWRHAQLRGRCFCQGYVAAGARSSVLATADLSLLMPHLVPAGKGRMTEAPHSRATVQPVAKSDRHGHLVCFLNKQSKDGARLQPEKRHN